MERDASLEDFLDDGDQGAKADDDDARADDGDAANATPTEAESGGAAEDEETGADQRSEESERSEEGPDDELDEAAVDDAVASYDWSPDGTACDACGEPVERRWRDEAGLVCGDCKDW